MIRCIFACYLSLFCLFRGTFGQVAKGQQPPAAPPSIDSEYRKFDDLLSFLRTRNAQQYAISSRKGIDEASFVTLGGIEQWIMRHPTQKRGPPAKWVKPQIKELDRNAVKVYSVRDSGALFLGTRKSVPERAGL